MPDFDDMRSREEGAQTYRMFVDGTLDYTNSTHKSMLDNIYNQMINGPDLEIFNRYYVTYLRTYHPYMMRFSYGQLQTSI